MTTTLTSTSVWDTRAELAQDSFDHFYRTDPPQLFDNTYPVSSRHNDTFNYWWLAHLIDARVDAYDRSGDPARLEQAEEVYRNILERNGNSLFNDYFDDMLWYALAIVRLFDRTSAKHYLDDAIAIWDHVITYGWNGELGDSLAWRKQQLYYKNTPANGPLIILGCRLFQRDERANRPDYLRFAETAFDWLSDTLVNVRDGFVEDGINREGSGMVDTQWRFTYNQGLYIGAAVELSRVRAHGELVRLAIRTALTAIRELAPRGVFEDEGAGGDEGLFKGIYYRYVALLLEELPAGGTDYLALREFVTSSTDSLWRNAPSEGYFLAANDWTRKSEGSIPYSTQLSAMMATELRARLENQS
ncbi:glycoside hydrolase family 76 protein [Glaciihabitans sp. UYNi722]|uniref:glycoside hydrolase family 76 protein n=1 Tax=Glaciihabitans sp. UYNi722 TaxID=3156344 RepID=UPI003393EB42